MRYCLPICVVCVSSHNMDSSKANLILEKIDKKLGFGQTPPPPWLVQKTFSIFLFLKAPLNLITLIRMLGVTEGMFF